MWVDEPMEEVDLVGSVGHDVTPPPGHLTSNGTVAAAVYTKRSRHDASDGANIADDDMMHDRIKRLNIGREGARQRGDAWYARAEHAREHADLAARQTSADAPHALATGLSAQEPQGAEEVGSDVESSRYYGINQLLGRMHVERETRRRAAYEAHVRMGGDPALIPIECHAESDDDL
mmetsp:Transcript_18199/g.46937  ORF Transcript_18199/g.46937 Transcript_18199/m.46937 type:complete len:177 (-) Transcript_18199:138-668(-)